MHGHEEPKSVRTAFALSTCLAGRPCQQIGWACCSSGDRNPNKVWE